MSAKNAEGTILALLKTVEPVLLAVPKAGRSTYDELIRYELGTHAMELRESVLDHLLIKNLAYDGQLVNLLGKEAKTELLRHAQKIIGVHSLRSFGLRYGHRMNELLQFLCDPANSKLLKAATGVPASEIKRHEKLTTRPSPLPDSYSTPANKKKTTRADEDDHEEEEDDDEHLDWKTTIETFDGEEDEELATPYHQTSRTKPSPFARHDLEKSQQDGTLEVEGSLEIDQLKLLADAAKEKLQAAINKASVSAAKTKDTARKEVYAAKRDATATAATAAALYDATIKDSLAKKAAVKNQATTDAAKKQAATRKVTDAMMKKRKVADAKVADAAKNKLDDAAKKNKLDDAAKKKAAVEATVSNMNTDTDSDTDGNVTAAEILFEAGNLQPNIIMGPLHQEVLRLKLQLESVQEIVNHLLYVLSNDDVENV